MRVFHHIIIALSALGFASQSISAQPLTRAEQQVCSSLRMCADLVKRHDASEFDYAVLTQEFRRFGPQGRAALFDILESDKGTADVAELIKSLGPLSAKERAWRDAKWSGPLTDRLLPLADETSQWVVLLDHPERGLREVANTFLFTKSHDETQIASQQIKNYGPLLAFLAERPSEHLAEFLVRIPVEPHRDALAGLLLSGERATAGAAYAALYRDSPSKAFQTLLSAMRQIKTVDQARGIGGLLAERDKNRADGFYFKFVSDLSADESFPVAARAAALDGYLKILAAETNRAPLKPVAQTQRDALAFLLSSENWDAPTYAQGLSKLSERDLPDLWTHLDQHLIPNAGVALAAFEGKPFERTILTSAMSSRDGRVRDAAKERAKAMKLTLPPESKLTCRFKSFDTADLIEQMPFFEKGFISRSWPQMMQETYRKILSAAHPTQSGWLAGYDQGEFGGGLVFFENKTGDGTEIRFNRPKTDFDQWTAENVAAILPERPLRLGETAQAFWVVTELKHFGGDGVTVFRLTDTSDGFSVKRMTHDIGATDRLAVTAEGELLMGAADGRTIRLSPEGRLSHGCPTTRGPSAPAPN